MGIGTISINIAASPTCDNLDQHIGLSS